MYRVSKQQQHPQGPKGPQGVVKELDLIFHMHACAHHFGCNYTFENIIKDSLSPTIDNNKATVNHNTMSEVKPFQSKTAQHILSYTLISKLVSFLATISIVATLYAQVIFPLYTQFIKLISSYEFVAGPLAKVDSKTDEVLSSGDYFLVTYPKSKLKSANKVLYSSLDKYLPSGEDVKKQSEDEIVQFINIVNDFWSRVSKLVSDKSSQVSKNVISTYNKEITSNEKASPIAKNLQASYNTATKSFQSLNESFIQPLKEQTQGYVAEVTQSTKNKFNQGVKEVGEKKAELVNGNAPILSSA
jgi:hypothetical protein